MRANRGSSVVKTNTITKRNIKANHDGLFKRLQREVKPRELFAEIMDYPALAHARHTERFSRLLVTCIRKGMIDPNELDKPDAILPSNLMASGASS